MSSRYQQIAAPAANRPAVSQATAIEQSRVVAEVQAAVLVAQQNRRNRAIAVSEMEESTRQKAVAERAFFRFPRAGGAVSGPSIHLARELARCWGNIQFGVTELRRDDVRGESEMQAYAWDLETNARTATTFIVPHKRDTRDGAKELVEMRDIYENNANNGARRLREAIFTVLPGWFVEAAQENCRRTLESDGGSAVPLPQRIAKSIAAFAAIGVTLGQLETKLGRKSDEWTEADLSELTISFRSIKSGDIARDDEFPPTRVTAGELTAKPESEPEPAKPKTRTKPKPATAEPEPEPAPAGDGMDAFTPAPARLTAKLGKAFIAKGIERGEVAAFLTARVGRPVRGANELSVAEVESVLVFLETGEEPVEKASEPEAEQLSITEGTEQ